MIVVWVTVTILVIAVMILIHELGHFWAARAVGIKAETFSIGFGPEIVGWDRGGTHYAVKWFLAGGSVKILGMDPDQEIPEEERPRSYREAPYWKRTVVILAGSMAHVVVAMLIFFTVYWAIGEPVLTGRIGGVQEKLEVSTGTEVESPAYEIGLKKGDLITGVDGVRVDEWGDLIEELSKRAGQKVTLEVRRGDRMLTFTPTLLDVEGRGILGFEVDTGDTFTRRIDPLAAVWKAVRLTGASSAAMVRGLVSLFSMRTIRILLGQEPRTVESPRGIVGAAQLAFQAARYGVSSVLLIIAQLLLFLAIFNLIPLPPFDGGHLLVIIVEKIFRREVDIKKLVPVAWIVIMILSVVAVRLLYLDVTAPIPAP